MSELGIFYPTIPEAGEIPVVRERRDSEKGCYLVFEGEDCFETNPPRPFYVIPYLGDSDTPIKAFVIPDIQRNIEGNAIYRFTVVNEGSISGGIANKRSEKTYTYSVSGNAYRGTIYGISSNYQHLLPTLRDYFVWSHNPNSLHNVDAMSPQDWWNNAHIKYESAFVTDMSDAATTFNQVITTLKQLSASTPETMVTKYMPLDATYQVMMTQLILGWSNSLTVNKTPIYYTLNNGTFTITDVTYTTPTNESFATGIYKEIDFTNNKIYDMKITFNEQKLFFQCTCHEATSLM